MPATIHGALARTGGSNPPVQGWCAGFRRGVILPHAAFWGWVVAFGAMLVGVALILLGLFTGVAALFGGFMNFNHLMAGTVSINPLLFVIATLLVLAWKVARSRVGDGSPAGSCRRPGRRGIQETHFTTHPRLPE